MVRIFFLVMTVSLFVAYTILVCTIYADDQVKDVRYLTQKVQEQYFEIQELKTDLSVCNWELGNTQTIELNAYVMEGMIR